MTKKVVEQYYIGKEVTIIHFSQDMIKVMNKMKRLVIVETCVRVQKRYSEHLVNEIKGVRMDTQFEIWI